MTEQQKQIALECLTKAFEPDAQDCQTPTQDLQLAITLNPSLERLLEAMEAYHAALTPDSKEPVFSLQQALGIWDEAIDRTDWNPETDILVEKKDYFKTKFNIDI